MKILVVTPTYLPIVGGAEFGIFEIYRRLGQKHDVSILTPQKSEEHIATHGTQDPYYDEEKIKVYRFNDKYRLNNIFGKEYYCKGLLPPFSVSYVKELFHFVKLHKQDLINFHYITPCGLALVAMRVFGNIPIVLSLVGRSDVVSIESNWFRRLYYWVVIKASSLVISNSRYYLQLGDKDCVDELIIPYGVDIDKYKDVENKQSFRLENGIDDKTIIIFTLQRLSKEKRVDILIKSMKYILEKRKDVLLIIGGIGPEGKNLKDLCRELNVSENVRFSGYINENDLPGYFAMSDIFAFPSPDETFGIVFAQAMAAGLPIVAVRSSSTPEVVEDGINGLLANGLIPEKIAEHILTLMENEKLRKTISSANREKAVSRYNWDVIANQYETAFKRFMN